MRCLGTPGTFRRHCSQSCVYSDETTWCPRWKIPLENPWKRHFRDSKFHSVPRCLGAQELACAFCASFKAAVFIISLLLKNCLTALKVLINRLASDNKNVELSQHVLIWPTNSRWTLFTFIAFRVITWYWNLPQMANFGTSYLLQDSWSFLSPGERKENNYEPTTI